MSPKQFKALSFSQRLNAIKGKEATERQSALKQKMTPAEVRFASILDVLRIPCTKQKVVYCEHRYFILDFVIQAMQGKPKTIIEIDGGVHIGRERYDDNRTRLILLSKTYHSSELVRFTNDQVFNGFAIKAIAERYPRSWSRYGPL